MLRRATALKRICDRQRVQNAGISFVNILGKDIGYFTGKQIWDLSSFSLDENFTYIFLGFELYLFNKKIAKKIIKKYCV